MILRPKVRGFVCVTAHPVGCAAYVQEQIDYVKSKGLIKNGPKAGQPTVKYYVGIAIPKQPNEQTMVHEGVTYPGWVQSDWGKQIWQVGQSAFPGGIANSPVFGIKGNDYRLAVRMDLDNAIVRVLKVGTHADSDK